MNHSFEYIVAMIASCCEFWLEATFAPGIKEWRYITFLGIVGAVIGQYCRTLSMWTAGSNFNHQIQGQKKATHQLVTHGIYR